ncbi:MAG: acyltransferase [Oscillospiraceae bacterium]|nr:acyltransferase [Oscillospiraceae bacterium]
MGTNKATEKSKLRAESADDFGWLDILRWMATAAVVVCHTLTALGRNPDTYGLTQHTAVVYMALSRLTDWAVPVFLMISGVLYFSPDRDLSYRRVLFRYERRILLALLIFGYPMCLAERFLADRTLAHAGTLLLQSAEDLLTGTCWDHMWYLYMLAGLLLILPPLKRFLDFASDREVRLLLWILFLFTSIAPTLDRLGVPFGIRFPISGVYLFFMLLGYYTQYRMPERLLKGRLWAWIALLSAASCFAVQLRFPAHELRYASPLIGLLGWSVFCLVRSLRLHSDLLSRGRGLCFGIYLVHPAALHLFYQFLHLTPVQLGIYTSLPLFALLFFTFGLVTSWVLRQIPFLRKYVL